MLHVPARPVRLLVDVQSLQGQSRNRGLGRYTRDLATALIRQSPGQSTHLDFNVSPLASLDPALGFTAQGTFRSPAAWWAPSGGPHGQADVRRAAIVNQEFVKLAARDYDAVLFTSVMEGLMGGDLLVSLPNNRRGLEGILCAAVLYDLIPLLYPERYLDPEPEVRRWYEGKVRFLKECDLLLAISEATKADAVTHLGIPPHRIVVIGAGAAPIFVPSRRQDDLALSRVASRLGITRPFVLTAGAPEWRKNLPGVLAAFASLPDRLRDAFQLVAVTQMPSDDVEFWTQTMVNTGAPADGLIVTGRISDAALAELYRHCALFVFPSLYEGFGLPLLEAIRCGAPVLGSDTSSMPEIVVRKDCLFDPSDLNSMAERIAFALDHPVWRAEVASGQMVATQHFTWETAAAQTLTAIETAVDETRARRQSRTRARQGLAVVMPGGQNEASLLPPAEDLLRYLGRSFAIRWFDPTGSSQRSERDDSRWERVTGYADESLSGASLVVYELDDDPIRHLGVLRNLLQSQGMVILHSTSLARLAHAAQGVAARPRGLPPRSGWLRRRTMRGPMELGGGADPDGDSRRLLSHILDHADGVVVESDYSRSRLEALVPGLDVPIAVIPTVVLPSQSSMARQGSTRAGADGVTCGFAVGLVIAEPLSELESAAVANVATSHVLGRTWVYEAEPGGVTGVGVAWRAHAWPANAAAAGAFDEFLNSVDVVVICGPGVREITGRYAAHALARAKVVVAPARGCLADLPDALVHKIGATSAEEIQAVVQALHDDPPVRARHERDGCIWAAKRRSWAATAPLLETFIESVLQSSAGRRSLTASLAEALQESRTTVTAGDRLL